MTDAERDCLQSFTTVDRSGAKTVEHACEALGLDDAALEMIRQEGRGVLETTSAGD